MGALSGMCHKKSDKKLKLKPIVSIRINFGTFKASVATPVKVFHTSP